MGITIAVLVALFLFKFLYDSYLTKNTEKSWRKFSEANPNDSLVIELNSKKKYLVNGKIRFDGLYICNRWIRNEGSVPKNVTTVFVFNEDFKVAIHDIYIGKPKLNMKSFVYMSDLLLQQEVGYLHGGYLMAYPINTKYTIEDRLVFFTFKYDLNSISCTGTIKDDEIILGIVNEYVDHHTFDRTLHSEYNLKFEFYDKNKLKLNENVVFQPQDLNKDVISMHLNRIPSLLNSIFEYNIELESLYNEFNINNKSRKSFELRKDGIYTCKIVFLDTSQKNYLITICFDENGSLVIYEHLYFNVSKESYRQKMFKMKSGQNRKNRIQYYTNNLEPNVLRFKRTVENKYIVSYEILIIGEQLVLNRQVDFYDSENDYITLVSEWKDIILDFYEIGELEMNDEKDNININRVKFFTEYNSNSMHDLI